MKKIFCTASLILIATSTFAAGQYCGEVKYLQESVNQYHYPNNDKALSQELKSSYQNYAFTKEVCENGGTDNHNACQYTASSLETALSGFSTLTKSPKQANVQMAIQDQKQLSNFYFKNYIAKNHC